ncbi:MAG: hypothetical protein ACRC46_11920 [Thermoguttaceae bacterium]
MISNLTPQNILDTGFASLTNSLGILGTEIFVVELQKGAFDYTKWRQANLPNVSVDEYRNELVSYCEECHLPETLLKKTVP